MKNSVQIDRNLALEAVRVTEAAAIAASGLMGCGDERLADNAAMEAMQNTLNRLELNGTIRIGEGLPGEATALCAGDKVGTGDGPKVDVALVPIEGKSIVARGGANAMSVVALAEDGGFLVVPDIYMDKIAVGPGLPEGIVDLDNEPEVNIKALADVKGVATGDLIVCILDRPRHTQLIAKVRATGAKLRLIQDGDVSGVLSTAWPESDIDLYMGIGGAQQGVLAAAALRGFVGQMQGRLVMRNNDERLLAHKAGIEDLERKYSVTEMASGIVTFAATGVTYGSLLGGVRRLPGSITTESVVLRSMTGTIRFIKGHHSPSHSNGLD